MRGGGFSGMRAGSFSGMRGGGFARGGGFRGSGFVHRPSFNSGFGFNRFGRTAIVPVYYGGFGFYDSYPYTNPYSYAYPSSYGAGYAYSAPPVTVLSQNYYGYQPAEPPPPAPPPAVREYVQPAPPPEERKYEQPLYLVAFNDHTIRAVLAYWVEGATLHYVTMDHEQKQVPLASIDRALSERFNRERNIEFRLAK
jgi:hypothetical protein